MKHPLLDFAIVLIASAPAPAQYDVWSGRGTVAGTGVVEISRAPEHMRMEVEIPARGAGVKAALASLQTKLDAGRAQLAALGAIDGSIAIGEPRISTQQSQQQQQIEQMIASSLRRTGRRREKKDVVRPVTVIATVTAEWKLPAGDSAELLVAAHELQERIRAAKLAGEEEESTLTPEEQEILEESGGMFGYNDSNEPRLGEPTFTYVTLISDAEHAQAIAEAFQKARAQATQLATATGGALGKLESVSTHAQAGLDEDDYGYQYNSASYRAYQRLSRSQQGRGGDDPREAVGLQPGKVVYRVHVSAGFGLKE